MAVDRNAVREGTRWWFDGEEVLVQEVTPKSIVFLGDDGGLGLIAIADFLVRAEDPAISRHDRVVKRFSRLVGRDPSDEIVGAILYLLERVGPPVPGPVPAWVDPKPAPHPVPDVAEPLPVEAAPVELAEAEPLEDYAIAMPADEPPSVKKRKGW